MTFNEDHERDMQDPEYRMAYLETTVELYRHQIRYLLSELERVGWTPYPPEDIQ